MHVHRLVRQRLRKYIETVAQRRGIERVTSVEWLPCRGVAEGMVLAEGSLGEAGLRDHLARLCPLLLLGEELSLGVRVQLEVLLVVPIDVVVAARFAQQSRQSESTRTAQRPGKANGGGALQPEHGVKRGLEGRHHAAHSAVDAVVRGLERGLVGAAAAGAGVLPVLLRVQRLLRQPPLLAQTPGQLPVAPDAQATVALLGCAAADILREHIIRVC